LLANLALDGMEQAVAAVGRRGDKIHFVRYADDFIVTGANRQLLEQKVTPAQTVFLQPRGLELSEQKTVITHIQTGFDFLGHTVRKYGDKLLITPAKSKVKILRQKISQKIQSALGLSQEALLRQLNPLLRGWANYYRNGAAKETFAAVDHYVFHKLRRWAARRHPKKSQAWKKRKYFSAAGETGGFSVQIQRRGKSGVLKLYRLASTRIERHIKVKGQAQPYDPQYTQYFEQRRCFAWRVR
jgi:RNA-directed DNA polymerase